MSDENDLDRLLSAPLHDVEDGGFSRHIAAEIASIERRQSVLEMLVAVSGVLVVLAVTPLAGYVRPIETLALEFSFSIPVAIACAMLVLSQSLTRILEE